MFMCFNIALNQNMIGDVITHVPMATHLLIILCHK